MGSWRWAIPSIGTQAVVLCPQQVTKTDTVHRIGQDGCWEQFGTPCILIKACSGSTGPVVHPRGLIGLAKSTL